MNPKSKQNGYIAVMSAVIISVLLLSIVAALSFSTYFTRFNIFDSFTKERSRSLAESCADYALLKLRELPSSYAGDETITVSGDETCAILPFETSGSETVIKTTATVLDVTTNIQLIVEGEIPMLISWEEI